VFPDAQLKIFLVASAEERGRRRLLDHGLEVSDEAVKEEAARLAARDAADSSRSVSPLRQASDAVQVDTTEMDANAVVQRIVSLARDRGATIG